MDPIKVDFSGKGKPKEVVIPPEKKVLKIIICILTTIVGGCITYYFMLPAINLKEIEFYYFKLFRTVYNTDYEMNLQFASLAFI